MMEFLRKYWDFLSAIVLAVLGGHYLPNNSVSEITTELIAFFSIQSAVILPAMIFTAGILKPDGLELTDAQRYHKALKSQMHFWVVLLGLDFVAVAMLITGKALGWTLLLSVPFVDIDFEFASVLFFLLQSTGTLAIFRTIPFVKGVLSLLDLNSDMTNKAISRRNKNELAVKKKQSKSRPMDIPDGYGNVINAGDEK